MDTLIVVLIAGVIVVHTSTGYVVDFAGWYYDDERTPSFLWQVVLTLPAVLGSVFGLGPLFLVAGWFSAGSLARRGPASFAAGRVVRLGVPVLFARHGALRHVVRRRPAHRVAGVRRAPHRPAGSSG